MSRSASGLKAWALQRATAIYIGLYLLYLLGHFLFSPPASHAQWDEWLSGPWVSNSFLLFILAILMHTWIGMRDILIDYVKPLGARLAALMLVGLVLIGSAVWSMQLLVLTRVS